MKKISSIVFIVVFYCIGCAPERPKPAFDTQSILNIQIIEIIGPTIRPTRSLSSPRDIAVNRIKEIFIADYGNDRIIKLDSTFSFVAEFGGFGASDYSLNGPVSIAIDNVSNLYLIDSGNSRVLRFDRRLNFISDERGYVRSQQYNFIRPSSIKVTKRGDIYIGDEGLGACFKLDPFFVYIHEFGTRGSPQEIGYPSDIEYGKDNKVYVADSEFGRIMVYDDFGMFIHSIGEQILEKPSAVAVSSQTGIWVTDMETGLLHCFNFRGEEVFRWGGQERHYLVKPAGLFIDDDDTIYIVDSTTGKIYVVKPILRK
jgi:DNA-binding beta-propeller fold protein YncE